MLCRDTSAQTSVTPAPSVQGHTLVAPRCSDWAGQPIRASEGRPERSKMGEGPTARARWNIQSGQIREESVLLLVEIKESFVSSVDSSSIGEVGPPTLGCSSALKPGSSSQFNPCGGHTHPQSCCLWPTKEEQAEAPLQTKTHLHLAFAPPAAWEVYRYLERLKAE